MAERSLCLPLASRAERLDQAILEVPPSLIFQDFVPLDGAHHWCKASVVICAVLESRTGGEWKWRPSCFVQVLQNHS